MRTDRAAIIRCIYCKEDRPRPTHGEHVMLEALRGSTTIHDVCGACNQRLGDTIDNHLLRESPLAMMRLLLPDSRPHERPVFQELPLGVEHAPAFVDCIARSSPFSLAFPPQLLRSAGKWLALGGPSLVEAVLALLATDEPFARVRRSVVDKREWSPPRLVQECGGRRFCLRARTESAAREFCELLVGAADELRRLGAAEGRDVVPTNAFTLATSCDVNAPSRCAAKIAFNFLSFHLGPEIALLDEFDPIRRYITGEDVEPVVEAVHPETGEVGFTVDVRFVANWIEEERTPPPWPSLKGHHLVCLTAYARHLAAMVVVYGHTFKVRLGRLPPGVGVARPLPMILATPFGGGGDLPLTIEEIAVREGLLAPDADVLSPRAPLDEP